MKVKAADTQPVFKGVSFSPKVNWKSLFIGLVVINLIAVLGVAGVARKYDRQVVFGLQKIWGVVVELLDYPEAVGHYLLAQPSSAEKLYVDIKHIEVQNLEYQRTRTLNEPGKYFEYVPATIRVGSGVPVDVKMRVKGDRSVHYNDFDKTSYRIRVKGDNTVLGMKIFSLQKSRVRNHIHEWIFLDMARKSGLVTPRYEFIQLIRNGKNLGIFALEEHYDKHLIEANRRRDGPIIRFDEHTNVDYKEAVIAPYRYKRWTQHDKLPLARKAVQLLEAFRRQVLTVSEVFDVEQLAAFLAITDLMGTHHAAVPKSLRFYYNPITSKLEPIPFDGHRFDTPDEDVAWYFDYDVMIATGYGMVGNEEHWIHGSFGGWFRHLFNDVNTFDREFISKYMAELEKITAPGYLENYFSGAEEELSRNLDLVYKELPLLDNVDAFGPGPFIFRKRDYYVRRDRIRSMMDNVTVRAHLLSRDGHDITLEVKSSDTRLPLEILGLSCDRQGIEATADSAVLIEQGDALLEPSVHRVRARIPEGALESWQDTECNTLIYRILGTNKTRSIEITPLPFHEFEAVNYDDCVAVRVRLT